MNAKEARQKHLNVLKEQCEFEIQNLDLEIIQKEIKVIYSDINAVIQNKDSKFGAVNYNGKDELSGKYLAEHFSNLGYDACYSGKSLNIRWLSGEEINLVRNCGMEGFLTLENNLKSHRRL